MGELWGIIQAHLDRYGVTDAAFARRMGAPAQTLNGWKNQGLRRLPGRQLLEAVARETSTPYADVLAAALVDIGYASPTGGAGDVDPARPEPAAAPPSYETHVPRPEDRTGVAARPAHGSSRSSVEGAAGTRRRNRK